MKLSELLNYDKITIQCHDNPDADTIATGYAVYCYLKEHGKESRIIYGGRKITKDNLIMFVDNLKLPIENVPATFNKVDGLLITVDCQYGSSNVTNIEADDIIVIDHHQKDANEFEKSHIISTYVSCSTVVWEMLKRENFDFDKYPELQTALYYGIYTDSGQLINVSNPVDKDMLDDLKYDKSLITLLKNSNISVRELEIAGIAMIRAIVNNELRFAVVKAEQCDANILGLISDFVLQVSTVDCCVVFNILDDGIKFSTRSCVTKVKANHLAKYFAAGIGSGGGHMDKAGGFISTRNYREKYNNTELVTFFSNRMKKYLEGYEVIDVDNYIYDTSLAKKYVKNKLKIGYVVAKDIIPVGTAVTIRTLEGDLHLEVQDDTYIMIGVKGEIHPITKAKFEASYIKLDEPYTANLEYHPRAKLQNSGVDYSLLDYAKVCEATGTNCIYARQLNEKGVKVFTKWDRDCYMLGEIGDYIVARCDDTTDVYIIEGNIFDMTYSEV